MKYSRAASLKVQAIVFLVAGIAIVAGCKQLSAPADPANPDGQTVAEKAVTDASAFTAFLPPPWNFIANAGLLAAAAWLGHAKGKKSAPQTGS